MAITYCICVGLLLVIQTVVHGQPVESPVSAEAAGGTAAAAAGDASSAAVDTAQTAGGALTADGELGSSLDDMAANMGELAGNVGVNGLPTAIAGALDAGMAAGAAGLGAGLAAGTGALGLGAGAGTGALGLGAAGLGAGVSAGTGALGLGAAGLGAGVAAGTGALGSAIAAGNAGLEAGVAAGTGALGSALAAGNAGLGLSAQSLGLLGNPLILVGGTRLGSGTKLRSSSPSALRQMLAENANQIVRAIDDTTGDLTARSAQSLVDYGQAIDALMGNFGVDSNMGESLATSGGQVMGRGRDGTIYVMQNGVDRLFGVPSASLTAALESTPAAIVVG